MGGQQRKPFQWVINRGDIFKLFETGGMKAQAVRMQRIGDKKKKKQKLRKHVSDSLDLIRKVSSKNSAEMWGQKQGLGEENTWNNPHGGRINQKDMKGLLSNLYLSTVYCEGPGAGRIKISTQCPEYLTQKVIYPQSKRQKNAIRVFSRSVLAIWLREDLRSKLRP